MSKIEDKFVEKKISNKIKMKNFKVTSDAAMLFLSSFVCEMLADRDGWDKSRNTRRQLFLNPLIQLFLFFRQCLK